MLAVEEIQRCNDAVTVETFVVTVGPLTMTVEAHAATDDRLAHTQYGKGF